MASILRRPGSEKFYGQFIMDGVRRRLPLFADKGASESALRHISRLIDLRAGGETLTPELRRFIEGLPGEIKGKLAAWGVIATERLAASSPIESHIAEYESELLARGNVIRHVADTASMIRKAASTCGWRFLTDLRATGLQQYLADCRQDMVVKVDGVKTTKRGLSPRRSNGILVACKSFTQWLAKERRISENPLKYMTSINQQVDRRRVRRALTAAEVGGLIAAAEGGQTFRGMAGRDRAMIYQVALYTGLRYSEIKSLTRSSFSFATAPATVTVQAKDSKHRREDMLPLHSDLAARLKEYFAAAPGLPTARAFPLPASDCGFRMMKVDLAAAGIAYETDQGMGDFHSLRHTFISNLASAGIHPSVAQRLARHSDVNLTLGTYTHSLIESQAEALDKLPGIITTKDEERKAAGAEGVDLADIGLNDLHPGLHPQGGKQAILANLGGRADLKNAAGAEGINNKKTPENCGFAALSGVGILGRETGLEPATYRATVCRNEPINTLHDDTLHDLTESTCTPACPFAPDLPSPAAPEPAAAVDNKHVDDDPKAVALAADLIHRWHDLPAAVRMAIAALLK